MTWGRYIGGIALLAAGSTVYGTLTTHWYAGLVWSLFAGVSLTILGVKSPTKES